MVVPQHKFVIVPHVGAGPLRFGMLRHDVYQILGQPNWRREPNEFGSMTTEDFGAHDIFVEFELDGRCCSVDFHGNTPVFLDGANLTSMTYKALVAYLRAKGGSVVEEKWVGLRCDDLGVACYAPEVGDPDIPDARIESVLVYQRGYYDALDKFVMTPRHTNDN